MGLRIYTTTDAEAENHRLDSIADKQERLNRSTRGQWQLYASHRQEIERLLAPDTHDGRLCVLGAGNCNDLDLRWLSKVYREVHLVDIDAAALQRAVKFQQVREMPRVRLHAPVDLTGLADVIGDWMKAKPTALQVNAWLQSTAKRSAELPTRLGAPFERVLSPCVLSQLLTPIRDALGEDHPAFPTLLAALRARHLQLMLDLLTPGGQGVFVCDVLSSTSCPGLARATEQELPDLMRARIASGRYFTGLDPASIIALLERAPSIAGRIQDVWPVRPWLWHLGLNRCFLVYAVCFRRQLGAGMLPDHGIATGNRSRHARRILAP